MRKLPPIPTWVRVAVSVVLLAALIWWTGPDKLAGSLEGLAWGWLVAALLVNYMSMALAAFNVSLLTRALIPEMPRDRMYRAFLRSWALGMIAPGKLGDFTYSHFLSDAETNLAPGLAVAVVDKLITFTVTAVIAVIGMGVFISPKDAILGAGFALVLLVLASMTLLSTRLRRMVRTRLLGERATRFHGFGHSVSELLVRRKSLIALNTMLTIVRMVVLGIVIQLGFRAVHVEVSVVDVVIVQAITQLVSLVPVTFAGLGVRQGASIVLFDALSGIAAAPVLSVSLLMTAISYVNVAIVFAVLGGRREDV